jgi:primosomal protein N''
MTALTNADSSDQVLEPVAAKHLSEHLLGVLEALRRAAATTVLLPKLIILFSELRV